MMLNLSLQYGIPLDDRANYTKADWLMWTAALGNEDQVHMIKWLLMFINVCTCMCVCLYNSLQFNAITDMVYKFAHETEGRHPFPDW